MSGKFIRYKEDSLSHNPYKNQETYFYVHFTQRLKERYNIEISYEEFFKLNKSVKDLYRITAEKSVGTVKIKNELVYIIRSRKLQCMCTCIQINAEKNLLYPVPLYFKRIVFNKEEFNIKYDEFRKKILEISNWLKDNNGDAKKLYIENPFNVQYHILASGLNLFKKKEDSIMRNFIKDLAMESELIIKGNKNNLYLKRILRTKRKPSRGRKNRELLKNWKKENNYEYKNI